MVFMCSFMAVLAVFIVPVSAVELSEVILKTVPEWINLKGFVTPRVPIEVRLLAKKEELSLRAAVEVQNHFYDLVMSPGNKATLEENFQKALSRVSSGENVYENVWNQAEIDRARFIVVFDLDDTLINQYYSIWRNGPENWDIQIEEVDLEQEKKRKFSNNFIKLTPGWKETIFRIKKMGGAVVFFTAKNDFMSQKIIKKWMYDESMHVSKKIDGFMTKHHLILVPGEDWERGRAYPMKDLELIDPTLKRIILVDDNPFKTYQPHNVRVFQKYKPDLHLSDESPAELKAMYENLLPELMAEIEDTLVYMEAHPGVSFVDAYEPYSHIGRTALNSLLAAGTTREKALEVIRNSKELVLESF